MGVAAIGAGSVRMEMYYLILCDGADVTETARVALSPLFLADPPELCNVPEG